ncbi:hypothetical protein MIR68_011899 [Amoeboaphelidium protococcarum]|nr:hypothetical protein MIR68_011899 [Amoeboaphelidium protococcarum]
MTAIEENNPVGENAGNMFSHPNFLLYHELGGLKAIVREVGQPFECRGRKSSFHQFWGHDFAVLEFAKDKVTDPEQRKKTRERSQTVREVSTLSQIVDHLL